MHQNINREIIEKLNNLGVLNTNSPLSEFTSFKTGGPADIVIIPYNKESLKEILMITGEASLPLTIVSGCTNVLVSDRGIKKASTTMVVIAALTRMSRRLTSRDRPA